MVEVVIQGIVTTHQYGTLNTGDVLRTDAEFAKHLVEDCGAAKYREAPGEQFGEPAADAPEGAADAAAAAPPGAVTPAPAPAARGGRGRAK